MSLKNFRKIAASQLCPRFFLTLEVKRNGYPIDSHKESLTFVKSFNQEHFHLVFKVIKAKHQRQECEQGHMASNQTKKPPSGRCLSKFEESRCSN
jgi:hypothetical protein